MKVSSLKTVKCEKCSGPPEVYGGFVNPRSIFYLTDRIEVRCNNTKCGHTITILKEKK